jgi:hypothetical protein
MENKGKSVKVEDLQNERVEDSFDIIQYERVEDSFDGLQSDTNITLQDDRMQKHGDCGEASSKATKDFDLNIKADWWEIQILLNFGGKHFKIRV